VSERQSAPQAWYVALHVIPQGPPSPPASTAKPPPSRLHVAWPCVDGGPAQLLPHAPQFAGRVGSTHAPEQLSGVELSASQPTVHAPLVHVGAPAPASGPEHTFAQLPQCAGSVGSTHVLLLSSVVGDAQVGPWASRAPPGSTGTIMTTSEEPSVEDSTPPSVYSDGGENAADRNCTARAWLQGRRGPGHTAASRPLVKTATIAAGARPSTKSSLRWAPLAPAGSMELLNRVVGTSGPWVAGWARGARPRDETSSTPGSGSAFRSGRKACVGRLIGRQDGPIDARSRAT
jgi:hypothetical protein